MDYVLESFAFVEKVAADNKVPVAAAMNIIRQDRERQQTQRDARRSTPEEAEAIPAAVESWWESTSKKDATEAKPQDIAKILGFVPKQGNLTRISKVVKLLACKVAA